MTVTMPRKISTQWLRQRKTVLGCTAADSPVRGEIETEIREAEAEMGRREAFEAWVKQSMGALLNAWPVRHEGRTYDTGKAFVRKTDVGRWVFAATLDEAWAKYQEEGKARMAQLRA